MKVYVIKNKQTKEYQTVVMDFIPDIRQSDIFIDYEVALAYCPSDCEVVECELMEKTELADYTNQVRKEVLDIIDKKFNCCGYVEEKFEDIKEYILDQYKENQNA